MPREHGRATESRGIRSGLAVLEVGVVVLIVVAPGSAGFPESGAVRRLLDPVGLGEPLFLGLVLAEVARYGTQLFHSRRIS